MTIACNRPIFQAKSHSFSLKSLYKCPLNMILKVKIIVNMSDRCTFKRCTKNLKSNAIVCNWNSSDYKVTSNL